MPVHNNLILLRHAVNRLPPTSTGRPPDPVTIWRWATKGVAGVRLEALRIGRNWYTSEPAIDRFISRLTRAAGADEIALA